MIILEFIDHSDCYLNDEQKKYLQKAIKEALKKAYEQGMTDQEKSVDD